MPARLIRWAFVLGLLLLLGWHFRASYPVRGITRQAGEWLRSPAAPTAARKCVKDGQVLYTNGACPAGSQVQTVDQGAVNVVPAQAMPAQTAGVAPGASSPTVLQRLAPPDGNLDKNKQIEAAMQR